KSGLGVVQLAAQRLFAGVGEFDRLFRPVDAPLEYERTGVQVPRADLDAERHAALLPVEMLFAGPRVAEVGDDPLLGDWVELPALDAVPRNLIGLAAGRQGGDELV